MNNTYSITEDKISTIVSDDNVYTEANNEEYYNDTENYCASVDDLANLVGEMRTDFLSLVDLVDVLNKKLKNEIDEKYNIKKELQELRETVDTLMKASSLRDIDENKLLDNNEEDTISNHSSISDKTIKYTNNSITKQITKTLKDNNNSYIDSRINKNIRGNIYKIRKRNV